MSHSSMPFTLAPGLSRLQQTQAPFYDPDGRIAYLSLDVSLNHADIVFLEGAITAKPVLVSHASGVILLQMPANLAGVMAHEVLFDERGLRALKLLVFGADHTSEGIAVSSPKDYRDSLAFLVARARDFAELGSDHQVNAYSMSMRELGVYGFCADGKRARCFEDAVAFEDRVTGLALNDQESVDAGVIARASSGQAHGVFVSNIDQRLGELRDVTVTSGKVRAKPSTERGLLLNRSCVSYSSFMKQLADHLDGADKVDFVAPPRRLQSAVEMVDTQAGPSAEPATDSTDTRESLTATTVSCVPPVKTETREYASRNAQRRASQLPLAKRMRQVRLAIARSPLAGFVRRTAQSTKVGLDPHSKHLHCDWPSPVPIRPAMQSGWKVPQIISVSLSTRLKSANWLACGVTDRHIVPGSATDRHIVTGIGLGPSGDISQARCGGGGRRRGRFRHPPPDARRIMPGYLKCSLARWRPYHDGPG